MQKIILDIERSGAVAVHWHRLDDQQILITSSTTNQTAALIGQMHVTDDKLPDRQGRALKHSFDIVSLISKR